MTQFSLERLLSQTCVLIASTWQPLVGLWHSLAACHLVAVAFSHLSARQRHWGRLNAAQRVRDRQKDRQTDRKRATAQVSTPVQWPTKEQVLSARLRDEQATGRALRVALRQSRAILHASRHAALRAPAAATTRKLPVGARRRNA